MAKSARSSTTKENNRRLYAKVFGPAEAARNERLSAKLLELAKQPKPESSDVNMDANAVADNDADDTAMDLEPKSSSSRAGKKRIDKRKQKKSGIVFKKYSDRVGSKKKKSSSRMEGPLAGAREKIDGD